MECNGNARVAEPPDDLLAALEANPSAKAAWEDLTAIGRRDFTSWINEAKQVDTRKKRIQRACENLVKGKRRPCCYAVVPLDLYKALGSDAEAKSHWSALGANEKRDFSDWIESSPDKSTRKERVVQACQLLCAGKRNP
jgi:uncharacterized protein YdeI (YjbR/CyaY-like superfamily)